MKTVLLVRHAKSSWENFAVTDFDRPLNDRGKKNAPEMAKRLRKKNIVIDAMLSSPAVRAKKTAELFSKELEYPKDEIIYIQQLYHADPHVFAKVISEAPANANCIAIFSHNPGITDFANQLTSTSVDNMPTASVFAVQSEVDEWSQFMQGPKRLLFFDYPKAVSGT